METLITALLVGAYVSYRNKGNSEWYKSLIYGFFHGVIIWIPLFFIFYYQDDIIRLIKSITNFI